MNDLVNDLVNDLGARLFGLAAINMGLIGLVWGAFATGSPPPTPLPGRVALAYVVSVLLVLGGVLINTRRASGALLLTFLFALGLVLGDGLRLAMHPLEFGYWDGAAEQLALVSAGLVAYAAAADMEPALSWRLQIAGSMIFALCLFSFGAAHFVYLANTVSMVPKYIPPSQLFWAYFTGVAAIAAGLAILSGVQALLAARLLTIMYILFGILVHAPILFAGHTTHFNWVENALNYALAGAAWIVADSLATRERGNAL